MSELSNYEGYKKKLQGLCDEHDLVFKIYRDKYPISMTVKPCGGMGAQMSMLSEDKGYINPDACLTFIHRDGTITYKITEQFTIGDALFSKLKNLFKNLHYCWLQYFFREVVESGRLDYNSFPEIDDNAEVDDVPDEAEPLEEDIDDAEIPDVAGDDFSSGDDSDIDEHITKELYNKAIELVRQDGKATTARLQKDLEISFSLASRIMMFMEAEGIVGPHNGSEPREVLPWDDNYSVEEFENE